SCAQEHNTLTIVAMLSFFILASLVRLTTSQYGFGGLHGGFGGLGLQPNPYGLGGGLYHDPYGFGGGLYHDPYDFGGGLRRQPVVVEHHYHVDPARQHQKTGRTGQRTRKQGLFSSSVVHQLSAEEFPDESDSFWLVMFHDGKRPSKKAKPIVETLAKRVHETMSFKVGAVDCTMYKDFCRRRFVRTDYPTFAFLVKGKLKLLDDDDVLSAKHLYDFAYNNMPTWLVRKIHSLEEMQQKFLNRFGSKKGGILLLTDKDQTSALYYSLSYKYRQQLKFGEASALEKSIREHFQAQKILPEGDGIKLPVLLAFKLNPGEQSHKYTLYRYDGTMKGSAVTQWLDALLEDEKQQQEQSKAAEIESGVIQLRGKKDLEDNFSKTLRTKYYGGLIFLSKNPRPDPLLQRLVNSFSSKLLFAEDRHSNQELKSIFFSNERVDDTLQYPFFIAYVRAGDDYDVVWYDGPLQYFAVSKWLETTFRFDSIRNVTTEKQLHTQLLNPISNGDLQGGILLLTDQEEPTPMFTELSSKYKGEFAFAESRGANKVIEKIFMAKGLRDGDSYPFLVAFFRQVNESGAYTGTTKTFWYKGVLELGPVSEWIEATLEEDMDRSRHPDPTPPTTESEQSDLPELDAAEEPTENIQTKESGDKFSEARSQRSRAGRSIEENPYFVHDSGNVGIDPNEQEAMDHVVMDLDKKESNTNGQHGASNPDETEIDLDTFGLDEEEADLEEGEFSATVHLDDDEFTNIEDFDEESKLFLKKLESEKLVPTILNMIFEKATSIPTRHVVICIARILLLGMIIRALLKWSDARSRRKPSWMRDADLVSENKSQLSDFTSLVLYVHHNYLRIAWYVGVRSFATLFVLLVLKGIVFRISEKFGEQVLMTVLRFLGDIGGLAQGLFVLVMAAWVDVVAICHAWLGQALKTSLSRDSYAMLFVQPQDVLRQINKILGSLLISNDGGKHESHLNPFIFMYIDPFMGGGFHPLHHHGFHHPMMHGGFPHHQLGFHHPVVQHPARHHHINQIPGGLFYDLVAQNEAADSQQDEATKAIEEGFMAVAFIVSVLVVAPITEEIVFRHFMEHCGKAGGFLRRLVFKADGQTSTTWFGHCWWVVICSFIFAAAHLNNHIPTSSGVDTLYKRGSDIVEAQLAFALIQFFVTFFLSLRVFSPANNKTGLIGAMGAHFMWNLCALNVVPQLGVRVVFLLLRIIWRGLARLRTHDSALSRKPIMAPKAIVLLRERRKMKFE
ncbi:MAG: hypothetical protein SGBAC_008321, partial [Bacillariaceae sp.]